MRKRKSNMELLRIFSILFILIFHCSFKGGFSFSSELTLNDFILKNFYMLGELGVNLFVLISGYFMINSKFKWKKVFLLTFQVMFYNIALTLLASELGLIELSGIKEIFLDFFPVTMNRYWFFKAYIVLYIVSPYMNMLARVMSRKTYTQFLTVLLALYSVIPSVFGIFYNNTEGLLNYNRLIWLIIVYFIGAYIRLHSLTIINTFKKAAITTISSAVVMSLSILIISNFSDFFEMLGTTEPAYFWMPNTLPMVVLSVGVFGLFANMDIPSNSLINTVASTTLGIYFLHDGVLAYWLWREVFGVADYQPSPYLVLRVLCVSLIVLVVGTVIDIVRQFFEKYTVEKLLDSGIFKVSEHKKSLSLKVKE